MRRGTRIIPYTNGDGWFHLILKYPEGHTIHIASYQMPADGNWRANDAFYDGLQELYKARLKHIDT